MRSAASWPGDGFTWCVSYSSAPPEEYYRALVAALCIAAALIHPCRWLSHSPSSTASECCSQLPE